MNYTNEHQTLPPKRIARSDDLEPARPEDFGFSRFQLRIWHGMTFGAWRRLLKGNLGKVSVGRYGLLLSVTLLKIASNLIYGRKIHATQIEPDPLDLLHNRLFSCDNGQK